MNLLKLMPRSFGVALYHVHTLQAVGVLQCHVRAQATAVGVRCILRHRKALLQHMASPLVPLGVHGLPMRDWVRGVGGPVFTSMLASLSHGAGELPAVLKVLTMGTVPLRLEMAHAWWRVCVVNASPRMRCVLIAA